MRFEVAVRIAYRAMLHSLAGKNTDMLVHNFRPENIFVTRSQLTTVMGYAMIEDQT